MGLKKAFNKNMPTYEMKFSFDSLSASNKFYEQYQRLMADGTPITLPKNTTLSITEHLNGNEFPHDGITVDEGTMYINPNEETISIPSEHGDFEIRVLVLPLQGKLSLEVEINSFFELKLIFFLDSTRLDINLRRIDKGFVKVADVLDSYYKTDAIIKHFGVVGPDDIETKDYLQTFREIERLLEKAIVLEAVLGITFDFSKIDWKEDWIQVAELYAGVVEKRPFRQNVSLTEFAFTPSVEIDEGLIVGANMSLQSVVEMAMTVMGAEITLNCMMVFIDLIIAEVSFNDERGQYIITPEKNEDKPCIISYQYLSDEFNENDAKNEFRDNPDSAFEKYRISDTIDELCNKYYRGQQGASISESLE